MKHLLEDSPDDFEMALLRAGRDGEPSPEQRARALSAALGVLASAAPLAAPLAAKVAVASSVKPAAAGAASVATAFKVWIAVGLLVSAGAATVSVLRPATHARRAVPPPGPTPSAARDAVSQGPALATGGEPEAVMPASRPAVPENHAPKSPPAPLAVHAGLSGELIAIDQARRSLDERRPDEALRTLRAYDEAYPRGSLSHEAELLRIEALVRRGEQAEAVRRAKALETSLEQASEQGSLYRARLRAILGQ